MSVCRTCKAETKARRYRVMAAIGIASLTATAASPAYAYVGPGLGLSVIGTILALITGFFLAVAGFVWYPVKRLLRKRRAGNMQMETRSDESETAKAK